MELLVTAVFIVLLVGLTSPSRFIKVVALAASALIALGAFAAAVGLYRIGAGVNWTSDGPGILLVMLGIPIMLILAFVFGSLALTMAPRVFARTNPEGPLLSTDRSSRGRQFAILAAIVICLLAGVRSVRYHRLAKPSHDAPITLLASIGQDAVASLDRSAVLKTWSVSRERHEKSYQLSFAGTPAKMLFDSSGEALYLFGGDSLSWYDLTISATEPRAQFSGIRDVCAAPDDTIVVAEATQMFRLTPSGGRQPMTGLPADFVATKVACRPDSAVVAAIDRTRTLIVLDAATGRQQSATTLEVEPEELVMAPDGSSVIVNSGLERAVIVDTRTGESRQLAVGLIGPHIDFVGDEQILGGDVGLTRARIDTLDTRPHLNLGQIVTGLTGIPALRRVVVAMGQDLYVANLPPWRGPSTPTSTRLVDPRF